MDTTGKALVEFWKRAGDQGLMKKNTANSLQSACSQVLGVLDNWETLDVTALDRNDVHRRFVNKRHNDFKPESLAVYKRRFNLALDQFVSYTKNPEGWKPSAQGRDTIPKKRSEKVTNGSRLPETTVKEPLLPGHAGLVEYPFPLREGRFAYLRLPADLKAADVKRLTGFLNTLADDTA
jgi:hypothetical protein